jgi:hypothetical protein
MSPGLDTIREVVTPSPFVRKTGRDYTKAETLNPISSPLADITLRSVTTRGRSVPLSEDPRFNGRLTAST